MSVVKVSDRTKTTSVTLDFYEAPSRPVLVYPVGDKAVVKFPSKPDGATLAKIKSLGFRFGGGDWEGVATEENLQWLSEIGAQWDVSPGFFTDYRMREGSRWPGRFYSEYMGKKISFVIQKGEPFQSMIARLVEGKFEQV